MSIDKLQLRICTPTEPLPLSRGFYQVEEDTLYVPVGGASKQHKFFSYLESRDVRLDLDRNGKLVFIEVDIPRRRWPVSENFKTPPVLEIADIRWLDFRQQMTTPELVASPDGTGLRLSFGERQPIACYRLADGLLVETDEHDCLTSIWIEQIVDDRAGVEIAEFRKQLAV